MTHLPTIPGGNDVEMNPFEFIPQDVDTLNTDIARCAINVLSGDSYYYRRNHDVIDESVILTRRYQMLNDSLSSLSQDTISNMLQAKPQGRFQQYKMNLTDGKDVDIILDIAHNPEAFAALGQKLKYKHGNRKRFRYGIRFL